MEVIQLDDYDPRVSENAFGYCEALRYVKNIHAIYYVSDGVFQNCKELEIGTDAFVTCYIGENAFRGCSKLREIHVLGSNPLSIDGELTHQISIGNSAFRDCISLEKVVLGYEDCRNFGINIGAEAFSNCPEFKALVLNRDVVATVNLTSILGTKIATAEGMPTGEGFIYAPSALYEDYVANFTMQIVAGFGLDEATADYMSRAILRKNEDYPDICG